jgi:hypothetical protein
LGGLFFAAARDGTAATAAALGPPAAVIGRTRPGTGRIHLR